MPESELSKVINGKSVNVNIVNPPIENPWRTRGDYETEQREARERHQMFIDQHKAVIRSHWASIFAALFAGVAALATCALVYFSYQNIHKQQVTPSTKQQKTKEISQPKT